MNFTPDDDFAAVTDGLEPVLLHRCEDPLGPGEAVGYALRRATATTEVVGRSQKTIESDGRYTAADVAWSLPAGELSAPPRPGDVIEDTASHRFTILETRQVAMGGRWRCQSRELAIAYGLEDLVDVLQADMSAMQPYVAIGTWTVVREGIRARIQPRNTEVSADGTVPPSVRRLRIILEEPFDLDHRHRLRGPDGTLYRVVKAAGFPRLGKLQTVDVEQIPQES